jgi:hypothetical protein
MAAFLKVLCGQGIGVVHLESGRNACEIHEGV